MYKKLIEKIMTDPDKITKLEEAGLKEADFMRMKSGKVPKGWQVHHKLPLDDGGTNDFSNLILMKNEPAHKVITQTQRRLIRGMEAGETRKLDFPIPDGFVYPPKSGLIIIHN